MTNRLTQFRRDQRGAGAIEFALVAPALFALIIGIAQLAILFGANAGLKHAVAEAARHATIFPRPTNAQLSAKIAQKRFGLDPDHLITSMVPGAVGGRNYIDISISYPVPIKIPLVDPTTVTLVETRRVYVHPQ